MPFFRDTIVEEKYTMDTNLKLKFRLTYRAMRAPKSATTKNSFRQNRMRNWFCYRIKTIFAYTKWKIQAKFWVDIFDVVHIKKLYFNRSNKLGLHFANKANLFIYFKLK